MDQISSLSKAPQSTFRGPMIPGTSAFSAAFASLQAESISHLRRSVANTRSHWRYCALLPRKEARSVLCFSMRMSTHGKKSSGAARFKSAFVLRFKRRILWQSSHRSTSLFAAQRSRRGASGSRTPCMLRGQKRSRSFAATPMLRCRHEIAPGELPHSPNNRTVSMVLGRGVIERDVRALRGRNPARSARSAFCSILAGRAIKAARCLRLRRAAGFLEV
jgi:hypothetical protein